MTALSPVIFTADGHRYHRDDREMASVTTILDDVGANGPDKKWYREEHRTRGSRVHSLGAKIARFEHPDSPCEWDHTSDFPAILPYGLACERWCREIGFELLYAEIPVWSDDLGIAGTPDLIGYARRLRKRILVDIKTGRVPPSVGLQTAPYKVMAENVHGITIDARYSLLLTADSAQGEYRFRECDDPLDFGTFLHFLGVWNWLKQHDKLAQ